MTVCSRTATHAPIVLVPAKGWPLDAHAPAKLYVDLELCKEHASGIDPMELVIPETRAAIDENLAAQFYCPGDWERASIEIVRLDSEEFQLFKSKVARQKGQLQ